jgi:hypothetical protein
MERAQIMSAAAKWARSRGWGNTLAKQRTHEQTLLEHSLIEVDVLLEVLPIISSSLHYNLNETEQKILLVAVLAHDIGKETDEWQAYVRDPQPARGIGHIFPELTRAVVPALCTTLGFESLAEPVQRTMAHCAEFHHSRPGRSDGAILEAILTGGSDRFLTLASLVKAIDHFCSAATAREAADALERDSALGMHLRVARHEVIVRGVSSTFLHHAALEAFQQHGWKPLLYFSDATVYGTDPVDKSVAPTGDEIRDRLKVEIDGVIGRDVAPLMVGSPTGNVLPKPHLLSFDKSRRYLQTAAEKIGRQSFASAYQRQKKHVEDRGAPGPSTGKGKLKADVIREYWQYVGKDGSLYSTEMDRDAARISVAHPEMMVLKFFKAMMDPVKVEVIGQDGAARAAALYETTFGPGSWAALQSTSTIMPAKDMARTVDWFWALPGSAVDHPEVQNVAELPDQTRLEILVDLLDGIAQGVYATIARPSPREKLSQAMANAFARDLVWPASSNNVQALAQQQLNHYIQSKPFAGKESAKGIYLCPICNNPFDSTDGIKASADFIDNPQTHTNRGIAYGAFGYVMVCTACYYERLLLQVLLGSRPKEIITLLPRLNLGPVRGRQLVERVREWVERAKAQMRGDAGNVELGFSFGYTDLAARQLGDRDPFTLEPEELLSLFSYRFKEDTQKNRTADAVRRLKEEFDDDLGAVNRACAQSFPTWEAVVKAMIENRVVQQDLAAIRQEVFRLDETIHLVCQTPNLVFIPLSYEVAARNDESDSGKALRRLYVSILLSLVFDAAVAIHTEDEPVDLRASAGAAYVPPVPAVRSLVGFAWLPILEARRWLLAIGAASLLVRDTGLSPRSALYQILVADPPERILRRIEDNLGKQHRSLTPKQLRLIEQLPKFHPVLQEVQA